MSAEIMDLQKIQQQAQRMIEDDPTFKDAERIVVAAEKKGFWFFGKKMITLSGSVASEKEKNRAEEIVKTHSHGLEVISNLKIAG